MMKKLLCTLLAILLLAAPALANETVRLSDVNSEDTYRITLTRKAKFAGEEPNDHYTVQQGSATDGTYAYFLLESKDTFQCALFKFDMADWTLVDVVYHLPVDHGNDMTYNPNTNQLVVVHNRPNRDTISFIDPETLEIVGTHKLTVEVFSIAYSQTRNQYVVGLSGGQDFAFLDAEFNVVETHLANNTGYTTQGADCDDAYIYFPQWDQPGASNYVIVYDWEGNFVNQIKIKDLNEVESMFHVGDRVFIAYHAGRATVYEAKVEKITE